MTVFVARRGFGRSVVFAVLALSLAGCTFAVQLPPTASNVAPLLVREKLPLRAAIVMAAAEQEATYEMPDGSGDTVVLGGLGRNLVETLRTSLAPLFEEVTLSTATPQAGAYDVLLNPKILDTRLEYTPPRLRFRLTGSLRVSDRSEKPLIALRAEGEDASDPFHLRTGTESAALQVIPRGVAKLVERWGEQLSLSRDLEAYAKGASPATAQPPGSSPRPSGDIAISFSYPAEAARVREETITVAGLVTATKPVQRVELVVNGRAVPVSRDVRVQSAEVQTQPFNARVQLLPGENVIVVTAVDATGRGAQAARTVFREGAQAAGTPTAKLGTGERWAVVIGIDQYRDSSISSLRYAKADAESIFTFLTTRGGVKPTNARLLLNKDATQRNIREALGSFLRQRALRDDEVIIYYAGHGTTEPDASAEGGVAKYLVPWDADPLDLFASAIPMEEIDRVFGRLAARKILMVQDTCFSGGAGGRTFLAKGLAMRSTTLTDRFLQDLSQKEGRMILTASDVNQVSQEDPALGHGIFTHYFLEALGGGADLDGDGAVTVREVHLYLQRKVHERSGGAQTPQLYNIGDMVLVRK